LQDKGNIAIYKGANGAIDLDVRLEDGTVWLTQAQMAQLFESSTPNINEHILHIFEEEELSQKATIRNFRIVQPEGTRQVSRDVRHYNLDMVISVGYRIKSKTATQFRIWATGILRKFIADGVVLNEKLLSENAQRLEMLKNAVLLLERNIKNVELPYLQTIAKILSDFASGLHLLAAYDDNTLDDCGRTQTKASQITYEEFLPIIEQMRTEIKSDIFGIQKYDGFKSAIDQIYQTFGDIECYPTVEEKAAMLLYLIVKNHAFLDGNKRIAASCFLYFLGKNKLLYKDNKATVGNDALFSLTLLVANSKPNEMQVIKQVIVSILNRSGEY
jgi:prophage maintenance system killer protein